MQKRFRRVARSSEDRSAQDLLGASPLNERDLPADMRKYAITDWRSDHAKNQVNPGPPERGWGNFLHGTAGGPGPTPMPLDLVPVDLRPRIIQEYTRGPNGQLIPGGADVLSAMSPMDRYVQQIARDTRDLASVAVIERGLIARVVTVPTTPILIADAQFLRGYIFLNPAETTGLTTAGTLFPSAARTLTGVSTPTLGVANFLSGHFYVDVTAVVGAGTLNIFQQALDPTSLTFFDVQNIASVTAASVPRKVYTFVEQFGLGTDLRLRFDIPVGTTVTFSVGFNLKNGLAGTSSGVNQTIFIGSAGVTTTTGFPLLEGDKEKFFLRENTKLFAVAASPLELRVFEL